MLLKVLTQKEAWTIANTDFFFLYKTAILLFLSYFDHHSQIVSSIFLSLTSFSFSWSFLLHQVLFRRRWTESNSAVSLLWLHQSTLDLPNLALCDKSFNVLCCCPDTSAASSPLVLVISLLTLHSLYNNLKNLLKLISSDNWQERQHCCTAKCSWIIWNKHTPVFYLSESVFLWFFLHLKQAPEEQGVVKME